MEFVRRAGDGNVLGRDSEQHTDSRVATSLGWQWTLLQHAGSWVRWGRHGKDKMGEGPSAARAHAALLRQGVVHPQAARVAKGLATQT
jgi:hypothetical protein